MSHEHATTIAAIGTTATATVINWLGVFNDVLNLCLIVGSLVLVILTIQKRRTEIKILEKDEPDT